MGQGLRYLVCKHQVETKWPIIPNIFIEAGNKPQQVATQATDMELYRAVHDSMLPYITQGIKVDIKAVQGEVLCSVPTTDVESIKHIVSFMETCSGGKAARVSRGQPRVFRHPVSPVCIKYVRFARSCAAPAFAPQRCAQVCARARPHRMRCTWLTWKSSRRP